jgi:hypothetical protein
VSERIVVYNGLANLPNMEGFRFRGWMHNGDLMPCVVRKYANGLHYVANEETGHGCYDELRGWTPYMQQVKP